MIQTSFQVTELYINVGFSGHIIDQYKSFCTTYNKLIMVLSKTGTLG
jgi:hypothetical protein